MRGDHHVRSAKELDNRFDGQIGAERRRSEQHFGLGRCELLLLGAPSQGTRSLEAGVKYGPTSTPSLSLVAGGCNEEDADVDIGNEGRGGGRRDSSGGA